MSFIQRVDDTALAVKQLADGVLKLLDDGLSILWHIGQGIRGQVHQAGLSRFPHYSMNFGNYLHQSATVQCPGDPQCHTM